MAKLYHLKGGSRIPEDVVALASSEKIATGLVTAIGGVSRVRLAYYNHESKKYEEHDYEEHMEITSLGGNITVKDGKPFLHVHGTFGRRDLSLIGGHVISASIFPLLELVVTPTENVATRAYDESLGLSVIEE